MGRHIKIQEIFCNTSMQLMVHTKPIVAKVWILYNVQEFADEFWSVINLNLIICTHTNKLTFWNIITCVLQKIFITEATEKIVEQWSLFLTKS